MRFLLKDYIQHRSAVADQKSCTYCMWESIQRYGSGSSRGSVESALLRTLHAGTLPVERSLGANNNARSSHWPTEIGLGKVARQRTGDKRQGEGYSGNMITNRRLRNASENADWGNDNKEKSGRSRESVIGNGEGKARSERSQISKITMPMARRNREEKMPNWMWAIPSEEDNRCNMWAMTRRGTSSVLGQGGVRKGRRMGE